jgi:hypothetical protein
MRIDLKVSYAEKDKVKSLGARCGEEDVVHSRCRGSKTLLEVDSGAFEEAQSASTGANVCHR